MKIAVFGTGGVGGYFGGKLAAAGHDVTFIARGDHLNAIQERGLTVHSVDGDFRVEDAKATDQPGEVGHVDTVLVGVKAWQVAEAAEQMRPMVGPQTFVVPLENGVEAPDILAQVLDREHVLGGLCAIISFIEAPGIIKHAGYEPFVAFGELDTRPSERTAALRDAFVAAGVKAEIPPDIHVAMWRKFLFISSFSGVAAVTRSTAGELRSIPETREMLVAALNEVAAVAKARGVDLPEDAVKLALQSIDDLPEDGTASMQRDIMDGRPSELEAQNGAVVRMGREAGVPTPVHAFIYATMLPLERRARTTASGQS
jgi:2-dehydropantoate 2-reductase